MWARARARARIILVGAAGLLSVQVSEARADEQPRCKAEVVPALTGTDPARYGKWLQAKLELEDYEVPFAYYRADLDNDGKEDIVGVSYQGSGAYAELIAFSDRDGRLELGPGAPPPPGDDDGWFVNASFDRKTNHAQPLIRICGAVYMSFVGNSDGSREGYMWKGQKTIRACDRAWTAFQLADFQSLYDEGLYDLARNNLDEHYKACSDALPPDTRLRMLADLSVTSFRLGDYADCRARVSRAKKIPGAAQSKSWKALRYNESLCLNPPPPTKADFRWLLNEKGFDPRGRDYADLLVRTVPELVWDAVQLDQRAKQWVAAGIIDKRAPILRSHRKTDLRGWVRDNLWQPVDDSFAVDGPYVTVWGCRSHSCQERAILWVDTKTGDSAFAMNYFGPRGAKKECFAVGSRTLGASELPREFREAFADWKANKQTLTHDCTYFIDGRKNTVTVSAFE